MLVPDNHTDREIRPVVTAATATCDRCGRELTSAMQRVGNEREAYCKTCYGRLMFPDVREADMESLD